MDIEKNFIFIHPLSEQLNQLKDQLEENPDNMVFELDAVAEYGQLIGIMEYSITYSCDYKKTEEYLNSFTDFIKTPKAANYLFSDKTIPIHVKGKLKNLGLTEIFPEDTTKDNIFESSEGFYNKFLGIGIQENSEDIKEDTIESNENISEKLKGKSIDSNLDKEHQKIKAMAHVEIGSGFFSNFKLKRVDLGLPLLNSPFDKLQRKNVTNFTPVLKNINFKKINFKPIPPELKKNAYKEFEIKPPGELNKKKKDYPNLDLAGLDPKRKKGVDFKEVDKPKKEHNKLDLPEIKNRDESKRKKLDLEQKDLQRKRAMFEAVSRDLAKKKKTFEEVERELAKKKKKFEEVEPDNAKKRKKFEEFQRELEKKRKRFEEAQREFDAKRKKFEEVENEKERKKLELDIIEISKKNRGIFEEVQKEGPKWKKNIEDIAKGEGLKGISLEEFDTPQKDKKLFEEVDKPWNNKIQDDEEDENNDKKNHTKFEEVDIPWNDKRQNEEDLALNKDKDEKQELIDQEKINRWVTILDYSKFKEKKREGSLDLSPEEEDILRANLYDKELEIEEKNYFIPSSVGLEYLVLYNDMLHKENVESVHLLKLLNFAMNKEFNAPISFYLLDPNKKEGASFLLKSLGLFEGHGIQNDFFNKEDFKAYKKEKIEDWGKINIPTFEDPTFQKDNNLFVYPYFEDNKPLGFSVANFHPFKNNHIDAKKAELIALCAKGVILSEYTKRSQ